MGIQRMRDVPGGVSLRAPVRPREVETAVDDRPVGIVEVRGELACSDERGRQMWDAVWETLSAVKNCSSLVSSSLIYVPPETPNTPNTPATP